MLKKIIWKIFHFHSPSGHTESLTDIWSLSGTVFCNEIVYILINKVYKDNSVELASLYVKSKLTIKINTIWWLSFNSQYGDQSWCFVNL